MNRLSILNIVLCVCAANESLNSASVKSYDQALTETLENQDLV